MDLILKFTKWHIGEALIQAAVKHQPSLHIKGLYKGAKWHELKEGDSYNPLETSIMTKTNKTSIYKASGFKHSIRLS